MRIDSTSVKRSALFMCMALLAACAGTTTVDSSGMSFSKDPLLGKVVWNDLITDDIAAARRFYGGMFGWTFVDTTGPSGNA